MWRGKARILDIVYKGPDENFQRTSSSYNCWIILAVDQGAFYYEAGQDKGKAAFGDLVFYPPGMPAYRRADTSISFYRILFEEFDTHGENAAHPPTGKVTLQNTPRLASNFAYFRQYHLWGNKEERDYIQHLFEDLLFMMASEQLERQIQQDPIIAQVIEYLHQNYHQPINLTKIAEDAGLSPSWLTRRFKTSTNQTPVEYLTFLRLNHSQTLLIKTDDTIDTIAWLCGFQNGFYFSRVFTKKMGITPSNFRKMHRS